MRNTLDIISKDKYQYEKYCKDLLNNDTEGLVNEKIWYQAVIEYYYANILCPKHNPVARGQHFADINYGNAIDYFKIFKNVIMDTEWYNDTAIKSIEDSLLSIKDTVTKVIKKKSIDLDLGKFDEILKGINTDEIPDYIDDAVANISLYTSLVCNFADYTRNNDPIASLARETSYIRNSIINKRISTILLSARTYSVKMNSTDCKIYYLSLCNIIFNTLKICKIDSSNIDFDKLGTTESLDKDIDDIFCSIAPKSHNLSSEAIIKIIETLMSISNYCNALSAPFKKFSIRIYASSEKTVKFESISDATYAYYKLLNKFYDALLIKDIKEKLFVEIEEKNRINRIEKEIKLYQDNIKALCKDLIFKENTPDMVAGIKSKVNHDIDVIISLRKKLNKED